MLMISIGVLFSYPLQFFIPIQILLPKIKQHVSQAERHPFAGEMIFRLLMVFVTFIFASVVPNVGLLISLIGAMCSTSLALVFPVIIEYLVLTRNGQSLKFVLILKNCLLISLAAFGFFTGGYEGISQVVQLYYK